MTKFMEWIKSLMVLSTSLMNRRIITLRLSVGLENFILVWTLWHKILFKSAHYHYRVNMCSCKILSFWLEKGLYTCGAPDLVTGVQLIWWHKILCSWTSNNACFKSMNLDFCATVLIVPQLSYFTDFNKNI